MTSRQAKPSPLYSVLLSLVVPGLGHIYLGRDVLGLSLVLIHVSLGSMATLAIVAGMSSLAGVAVSLLPWCVLWLSVAIWAYRCAKNEPQGKGHPPLLYVLISLLALPNAASWALSVRERVVELFAIPSSSMAPSIPPGSHILVNKLAWKSAPLHRGDAVVFTNPNARHTKYIKRIIGLPNDTVEMKDEVVFLNGQRLDQGPSAGEERAEQSGITSYRIRLGSANPSVPPISSFAPLKVPNGHCFVLGDNRRSSEDSRHYGPVPLADVVGRVERVF